jgi:hypothetical protein
MPEQQIMGAYFRRQVDEDRATEMLATVLDGVPQFVHQLADSVGLPRAPAYRVDTQSPAPGCRIDLQVEGLDLKGTRLWLLWSEHKIGAEFGSDQLPKYNAALRYNHDGVPHRLMVVTLESPLPNIQAQIEDLEIHQLYWKDIAALANRAGSELAGASWRAYAIDGPDEIARRLLIDWLIFSENEELEEPTVEPLTAEMIAVLPAAVKAVETVDDLVSAAFESACDDIDAGKPREADEYWAANPPAKSWLARDGGELYAKFEKDDSWAVNPEGEPVFVAGMFLVGEPAERILGNRELKQCFKDDAYSVEREKWGRRTAIDLAKPITVDRIATAATADEQEALLARFFADTFRQLISYDLPDSAT